MGIVFRQSIKATLAVFSGAVIGAVTVVLGPRMLPNTAEYGFARNIVNQAALLQSFALLGFHHVIATYIPRYPVADERRKVLLTVSLLLPLIAVLLGCIPYFAGRDYFLAKFQPADVPYLVRFWGLLPLFVMLWSVMSLMESFLQTETRVAIAAFAREVVIKGGTLLLFMLAGFDFISYKRMIVAMVLLYTLPIAIMVFIGRRFRHFGFSLQWRLFSRREWFDIGRYAWYHLLAGAVLNVIGLIDSLMLVPLGNDGLGGLAVYSTAVFMASMVTVPHRAMTTSSFPALNEAYIAKDTEKVRDFFGRSVVNIAIASVGIAVVIAPNLPTIARLFPPSFAPIIPLCLILISGRLADALTGLNGELISISPHYKLLFRASVLLILLLITSNRILIPRYGLYGAAWSASISLIFFNVIKSVFLWIKFRLPPVPKPVLIVLLAGAAAAITGYVLPDWGPKIVAMGIRGLITALLYVLLLLWWKPSLDLRVYLASIRKRRRLY